MAPYAIQFRRSRDGQCVTVYRYGLDGRHDREDYVPVAMLSPLAVAAGEPVLRAALRASGHSDVSPRVGVLLPLAGDAGPRVACYALLVRGLGARNVEGMRRAADQFATADPVDAAWWLGMMTRPRGGDRAVRALRILAEVTE